MKQLTRSDIRKFITQTPNRKLSLRPELLTSGGIPRPMHGVNPRTILGREWWNSVRKLAYQSTKFHCVTCGRLAESLIEAHEVFDIDYLLGRMEFKEIVPLCWFCHSFIHRGRLDALYDVDVIDPRMYLAAVKHGNVTLMENGLKFEPYSGPQAEWEDWRMILFGKEYLPIYKSLEEWKTKFERWEHNA